MVPPSQVSRQQSSRRGTDRSSGRLCRGGGVSNLAVSASLSPRSTSTTQRRLASGAADYCLWPLRLEDEAVRIAVALRLGSELGSPHTCRCGSLVDCRWNYRLALQASSQPSRETPRLK